VRIWIQIALLFVQVPCWAAYPIWPVKAVPGQHRYVVDSNNVPVWLNSVGSWTAPVNATTQMWENFCSIKETQGYNSCILVSPGRGYQVYGTNGNGSPTNCYGEIPFDDEGTDFLSKVRTNYFVRAKQYIKIARDHGFNVAFMPMYFGINATKGYADLILDNSLAVCTNYGVFIGNQFKSDPNLVYVLGGDTSITSSTDRKNRITAIAAGILQQDTSHLISFDGGQGESAWVTFGGSSWLTADWFYDYNNPVARMELTMDDTQVPVLTFDPEYEGDWTSPRSGFGDLYVRYVLWTAGISIGGCNQSHQATWQWNDNWGDADVIYSQIAQDTQHLLSWMRVNTNWWKLSYDHTTDSPVHAAETSRGTGWDQVCVSLDTNDHNMITAYYPNDTETITFYLTNITTTNIVTAYWFNVRNGSSNFHGTMANTISTNMKPTDTNDWLLVFQGIGPGASEPEPPVASSNYLRAYMLNNISISGKTVIQ
jgi:hypothetical protein